MTPKPARSPALSGILPVEKGPGVTSFQVVSHVRRLLRAPKVGHGGTLDPAATGLLPLLIGEATKLMPYLAELDKEYLATVRLGIVTDTQDAAGAVRETRAVPSLAAAELERVLARFVGEIEQVPPMYSALHHQGKRLYEIAREGGEVDRRPRRVVIHSIALESLATPDVTIRVRCGSGTYVRALAADLGEALGCGAALWQLVRTRVGPYALADAVPWTTLRECRDGAPLWERVQRPDSALAAFAEVRLDAAQARGFANGQTVAARASADGTVRVYGPDDVFLGVGLHRAGGLKPERILHLAGARHLAEPRPQPV